MMHCEVVCDKGVSEMVHGEVVHDEWVIEMVHGEVVHDEVVHVKWCMVMWYVMKWCM